VKTLVLSHIGPPTVSDAAWQAAAAPAALRLLAIAAPIPFDAPVEPKSILPPVNRFSTTSVRNHY
jgi:hypothetical protein